jgi:hypothetical protein
MPLVTITDWEYTLLQVAAAVAVLENLGLIAWITWTYMHEEF